MLKYLSIFLIFAQSCNASTDDFTSHNINRAFDASSKILKDLEQIEAKVKAGRDLSTAKEEITELLNGINRQNASIWSFDLATVPMKTFPAETWVSKPSYCLLNTGRPDKGIFIKGILDQNRCKGFIQGKVCRIKVHSFGSKNPSQHCLIKLVLEDYINPTLRSLYQGVIYLEKKPTNIDLFGSEGRRLSLGLAENHSLSHIDKLRCAVASVFITNSKDRVCITSPSSIHDMGLISIEVTPRIKTGFYSLVYDPETSAVTIYNLETKWVSVIQKYDLLYSSVKWIGNDFKIKLSLLGSFTELGSIHFRVINERGADELSLWTYADLTQFQGANSDLSVKGLGLEYLPDLYEISFDLALQTISYARENLLKKAEEITSMKNQSVQIPTYLHPLYYYEGKSEVDITDNSFTSSSK